MKEKLLILELRRGNAKAFEELYDLYHARLYNFCNKFLRNSQDSEGLVQEVYIAIWENRENLDEKRSFSGFVFRIARNKVYNMLKRNLTHQVYGQYIKDESKNPTDLRSEIESQELIGLINKSIDTLPDRTKSIFLFSRYDGMTYKEIAQKLNISENVVDHEIRKALQVIKEKIGKYDSTLSYTRFKSS